MAIETPGFLYTRPAAGDLSSKQYYFMQVDSNGKVDAVASAGYAHDGILQNDPAAANRGAVIMKSGISKVVTGTGGSTRGARVAIDSSGKAILATTEMSVGEFLDTVSAGEIATILLDDGPSRRSRIRRQARIATLTGNDTLTVTSTYYQKLDPGGSARDVTLPAVADSTNLDFMIVNAADAAENLVVKNAGGSTIGTINQNEAGIFSCDGSSWVLINVMTIALS